MIWLLSNLWWLAPVLLALLAAGFAFSGPGLPVLVALLKRVPRPVWAVLVALAALGLAFQCGRWFERSQIEQRQEAAEDKADAKAAKVAGKAQAKAEDAAKRLEKERQTSERIREVVRYLDCDPLPDGVRDDVQRQVEAARRGVPAG